MKKIGWMWLAGLAFASSVQAQKIEEVLQSVEQNNKELHVQQQENHCNAHQGSQQQGTTGSLFTFKLSAVFYMIPFRQADFFFYPVLDVVHHTAQVTPAGIGRDYNFSFYVLTVDGIGTHRRSHICHV
jgi:hypothetical protein